MIAPNVIIVQYELCARLLPAKLHGDCAVCRAGKSGIMSSAVHQDVKDYYGKRVRATEDLLTNVCTVSSSTFSRQAKEAMKMIHPDVLAK